MNNSQNNHMEEIREDEESKSLSDNSLVSDFDDEDQISEESDFSS